MGEARMRKNKCRDNVAKADREDALRGVPTGIAVIQAGVLTKAGTGAKKNSLTGEVQTAVLEIL